MKKFLVLFIALACTLSLTACGSIKGYTHTDAEKIENLPPSACEDRAICNLTTNLSTGTSSYKLGDVDKNGEISNADILLLYRYIYNSNIFPLDDGTTPSPFTLGDVNKDGKITNRDILMFYKYIYNPTSFPFEKDDDWMGPSIWM